MATKKKAKKAKTKKVTVSDSVGAADVVTPVAVPVRDKYVPHVQPRIVSEPRATVTTDQRVFRWLERAGAEAEAVAVAVTADGAVRFVEGADARAFARLLTAEAATTL